MSTEIFAYLTGIGLTITGVLYLLGIHNEQRAAAWILIDIGIGLFATSRFWRW